MSWGLLMDATKGESVTTRQISQNALQTCVCKRRSRDLRFLQSVFLLVSFSACAVSPPTKPGVLLLSVVKGPGDGLVGTRPNFSGVWKLDRSENQSSFMRAIGYNFIVAQAAFLAQVTQKIDHKGDDLMFTFEVVPPLLAPTRRCTVRVGAPETLMTDDAGREMVLLNPTWNETVFTAGLRYLNPPHQLTIDRYIEDGCMIEHVRYPGKNVEMRRIFKKVP